MYLSIWLSMFLFVPHSFNFGKHVNVMTWHHDVNWCTFSWISGCTKLVYWKYSHNENFVVETIIYFCTLLKLDCEFGRKNIVMNAQKWFCCQHLKFVHKSINFGFQDLTCLAYGDDLHTNNCRVVCWSKVAIFVWTIEG